ncbi:Uncharacterized protein Fot_08984 [Forsythia ovata]|uniref:Uncharacterized protein n=1 Tax=Forsythia ovata TaxID=205694 RepID=A0ABD1WCQ9_9LAMI
MERINDKANAIKGRKTKGDHFFDMFLELDQVAEAHGIKNVDDVLGQLKDGNLRAGEEEVIMQYVDNGLDYLRGGSTHAATSIKDKNSGEVTLHSSRNHSKLCMWKSVISA